MSKSGKLMNAAAKAVDAKSKGKEEPSGEAPQEEEKLEDHLCPECHQKVLEHYGKKAMRHQ